MAEGIGIENVREPRHLAAYSEGLALIEAAIAAGWVIVPANLPAEAFKAYAAELYMRQAMRSLK